MLKHVDMFIVTSTSSQLIYEIRANMIATYQMIGTGSM